MHIRPLQIRRLHIMNDKYYDDLIKQRIGEALRNQSRKERLDFAQLEEWVTADRERRKLKNRIKRFFYWLFK